MKSRKQLKEEKRQRQEEAYLRFEKKVIDHYDERFGIKYAINWAHGLQIPCTRWNKTFEERNPEYFI